MSNTLTLREVEILRQIALGKKNKEIGLELFFSEEGAKSHLVNIFRKLKASCRTDAVVKAHKEGYINLMECK